MMNEAYEFITDDMYESALALGISKVNVNNRHYNCGWPLEEALTKPVGKPGKSKYSAEIMQLAKANGVSNSRFYNRIKAGMSEQDAATTPVLSKAEAARRNQSRQWRANPEHRQLAEANGIPYITFYKRVAHSKWDSYLAATTPVASRTKVNPAHLKLAKENGIPRVTFYARLDRLGWDSLSAATTPVKHNEKQLV